MEVTEGDGQQRDIKYSYEFKEGQFFVLFCRERIGTSGTRVHVLQVFFKNCSQDMSKQMEKSEG